MVSAGRLRCLGGRQMTVIICPTINKGDVGREGKGEQSFPLTEWISSTAEVANTCKGEHFSLRPWNTNTLLIFLRLIYEEHEPKRYIYTCTMRIFFFSLFIALRSASQLSMNEQTCHFDYHHNCFVWLVILSLIKAYERLNLNPNPYTKLTPSPKVILIINATLKI